MKLKYHCFMFKLYYKLFAFVDIIEQSIMNLYDKHFIIVAKIAGKSVEKNE